MRWLLFAFLFCSLTMEAAAFGTILSNVLKRIQDHARSAKSGASGKTNTPVSHAVKTVRTVKYVPSGAVYIRWGRKTCPPNNQLLYEGLAAGSLNSHSGGGANYLCLPTKPQKASPLPDGAKGCNSYIYGAEYKVCADGRGIFGKENGQNVHNDDVPCALCQTSDRTSHAFMPATTECPAGWTKEYQGYIMGAHHRHQRTEWVCVDNSPEVRLDTQSRKKGALFYFAEARCGTLPCPPYSNEEPFACVICTK